MKTLRNFCTTIVALLFTALTPALRSEDEHLNASFWDYSDTTDISNIIHTIVTTKFSLCEVVFLRDKYSDLQPSSYFQWIWTMNRPVHVMSLEDSGEIASKFPQYFSKTHGMYCLVLVILCQSVESCKFSNLPKFVEMLKAQGIIRFYRSILIYIEEETTNTTRPPAHYLTLSEIERPAELKDFKLISKVSSLFNQLRMHVTLIRKLEGYGADIQWFKDFNRIPRAYSLYQLLTWSTNWLPGGSPVLLDIWSPTTGFRKNGNVIIKTDNFKVGGQVRFAISDTNLLPFISIESDGTTIGVDGEIIHILERKWKIKPIFMVSKDRGYGRLVNQTWRGVVQYIIRKEAEIALGSVNYDHSLFISDAQLSPQLLLLQASVACEKPKILPRWSIVLFPFQILAWITILISFVSVLIFLKLFGAAEKDLGVLPYTTIPVTNNWLLTFGPLLQRTVSIERLSGLTSVRLLFGAWLIVTLVLSVSYSNILIGKFSVPPREEPILTIEDLLKREKPWDVSFTVKTYLESSQYPKEREVVARAEDLSQAGSLYGVNADNTAYIHFLNHTRGCLVAERKRVKHIIYHFSERIGNGYRKPKILLSKETFYLGPVGWAMRGDIDFVFMKNLFLYFNMCREIGILRRTEIIYAPRPLTFDDEDLKNNTSLSLQVLGVTFLLLLLGYFLSTLAFLVELITKKSTQQIHKMLTTTSKNRETDRSSSGKSTGDKRIDQITIQFELETLSLSSL